jgi:hypothetical protein
MLILIKSGGSYEYHFSKKKKKKINNAQSSIDLPLCNQTCYKTIETKDKPKGNPKSNEK